MRNRAAIIGAGVSGLTCGVVFAEREWDVTIFADETGQKTTSGRGRGSLVSVRRRAGRQSHSLVANHL